MSAKMTEKALARRSVSRVTDGVPASDGGGVKLRRMVGQHGLMELDPFLLFDVFRSDNPDDYIAGFPPHPHRGFETVTYMFAGRMRHEDNAGHAGVIESGGVQWMTAGRGIVHSEMPEQEAGLMWGTQLWVNLPATDKMSKPAYQEHPAADIPTEQRADGVELKVITGTTSQGTTGVVQNVVTKPLYLDVQLSKGAAFVEPLTADYGAMLFVVEGEVELVGEQSTTSVQAGQLAVLADDGDQLEVNGVADNSRFLLIAGKRLQEPVARYGPFVMNTQAEIQQAFEDYNQGRF